MNISSEVVEYIGYLGSFLSCVTFIPQVYHSWKSKSVGDLSFLMILIVISSTLVWLVYGYFVNSGPVMMANTVVLALSLILLYFKLTFNKK